MQPTTRTEHDRLAALYPGHITMVHDGSNYTLADGSIVPPRKRDVRILRLVRAGFRIVVRPHRGEIRIITPGYAPPAGN